MTSVERPSYATIVKQAAIRLRDRNSLSDNYAEIEYSEGFNELKLKPAPNAGGGSVSIEQSGGAPPTLNYYNVQSGGYGQIILDGPAIRPSLVHTRDIEVREATFPKITFRDTTPALATPTTAIQFEALSNELKVTSSSLVVSHPSQAIHFHRMNSFNPALNVTGVTLNNGAPTNVVPKYFTMIIGGVPVHVPCYA